MIRGRCQTNSAHDSHDSLHFIHSNQLEQKLLTHNKQKASQIQKASQPKSFSTTFQSTTIISNSSLFSFYQFYIVLDWF